MSRTTTRSFLTTLLLLGISAVALSDPIRLGGAYRGPEHTVIPGDESWRTPDGPQGSVLVRSFAGPDIEAYWMYWFEHNKEAILADRIRERRRFRPSTSTSAHWFSRSSTRNPVTEATKREVVLPVLVDALDDIHPWVRDAAVIALGKFGGPAAAEHLLVALDYPEAPLRQDALLALGLTGDRGTALLALVRSLAACNELDGEKIAPADPAYAALGLALLDRPEETLPVLLEIYLAEARRTGDPELAASCATALGAIGGERIVEAVARPIRSREGGRAQVYACHALGRIGGDRARTWLFRALSSRDRRVQAAAILGLSAWTDKAVIGYLKGKPGLKSDYRMSRLYAIWSLSRAIPRIPEGEPKRKLVRNDLFKYAVSAVRDKYTAMHAAVALAAAGDTTAADTLLEQLEEGGKYPVEVRSALAMSLGLSGDRRAVGALRSIARRKAEDSDLRGYSLFALGLMKDHDSLPLIRKMIEDPRGRHQVLRSGCWSLGLMGDRSDIERLTALLSRERKDPGYHHVRGAAAIAIGLIGDDAAVAPLVALAKEGKTATTVAFAIAALGCLVDKDPVPRIPLLYANFHYRETNPIFGVVMSIL